MQLEIEQKGAAAKMRWTGLSVPEGDDYLIIERIGPPAPGILTERQDPVLPC